MILHLCSMKKINLLFVFFYSVIFWAQSTNRHIKNASGTLLPDIVDYCAGESFSLKVDATATATGDYIDGGSDFPIAELEKGENKTVVFKNTTPSNPHKFSEPIDIGFSFSFYGKTYDKVVVGNYGRLVFTNVAELNNMSNDAIYEDRQFSGISPSTRVVLPSTEYNKVYRDETKMLNLAQIFFGYTYLYKASWDTESKKYNYRTGVFAGVKGLLVEFKGVVQNTGSGPGRGFNSSVLILEDGRIIVYVRNREGLRYNAIVGLQNETATKFLVTDDKYNNGKWNSRDREIFIFTPNQNLTPVVKWLVNGIEQHTGVNFNYTPSGASETLKAEIAFRDDAGVIVKTEKSTVIFNSIEKPQVEKTEAASCGDPAVLRITNYNSSLSYEWFSTANPSDVLGTEETFNATVSGTYKVRVKDASVTTFCEASDDVSVNIDSPIPPFGYTNDHIFSLCETNPTKVVNLLNLLNYPLDATQYTVKFYENGVEISDYSNYTLNSGDSKNITVKVETLAGATPSCSATLNFTVKYQAFPAQVSLDSRLLCVGTSQYTVEDFKTDHSEFSAFDITFWNNGNPLGEMVNPSELSAVKVRVVKDEFTCQFDYDLNFKFYPKVEIRKPTTLLPKQCESNPTFDFSVLKSELNNSTDVEITFHKTMEDARNGTNAVDGSTPFPVGISPVYIRVKNINTGCVATDILSFEVEVFAKPQPKATSISMAQCDGETFDLTQSITDLFSTQNPNIQYEIKYFSENGVELSSSEVLSYTPNTLGFNPYIEISYDGQCADRLVFDLKYNTLPTSSVSEISVCDEKTYSLNDFKNKVVSNPADYDFLNSDGSVMTSSFDLSSLPLEVQFYLKRKDTGCRSGLLTVTFKQLSPLPLASGNVSIENCDTEGDRFDGIALFDLTAIQSEISTNSGVKFTFYTDAARTQVIAVPAAFSSADAIVYVKVEASGYCPSYAEVQLNVKQPTRSTTLEDKYFICYGSGVTVDAGSENTAFSWSNGTTGQTATFTQAGSYSVILTNAEGCSYTHNFEISDENQPKIQQINQDNSKIEVIATGLYPIEYSFNGAAFSSSNVLQNPTVQEYIVRVRSVLPDGSYCEGAPKHLYTININNVITPNGDSKNDTWRIKNLDKMEQVEIQISDRYGKSVFHTTDKNKMYWDGKQNGRPLPTSSYWYVVKWFDTATQKSEVRQGWILLKNGE